MKKNKIRQGRLSGIYGDVPLHGYVHDAGRANQYVRVLLLVGRALTRYGIIPQKMLASMKGNIGGDLLASNRAVSIFIGAKFSLMVVGIVVGIAIIHDFDFSPTFRRLIPVLSGAFGLLLPDYALKNMRKRYLKRVDAGLGDALDLFLLCSEAGLGMEASMERVSEEMVVLNKEIAAEFQFAIDEMRVSNDQKEALVHFGNRTGLRNIKRLSASLIQTLETGASLGSVLRVLSKEIREDTLIRFESRAARLSIMLTFPMIVFLLPCIFIIVAGPAALKVFDALGAH